MQYVNARPDPVVLALETTFSRYFFLCNAARQLAI
jgi:hypothetical protein